MNSLRKYFSANRYPQYLFDKCLNKYLDKIFQPKRPLLTVPKYDLYFKLPFIGSSSYQCKKQINDLISKYFPQIKLNCVFVNDLTISSFFPFKDKIPPLVSSGVVYKYKCGQCQSTYIGETQKHLFARISQHKGLSFRTNVPLATPPQSNIREHALSSDHPIKIEHFKILAHSNNFDLRLLESIYIHSESPSLNNHHSSFPLNILK